MHIFSASQQQATRWRIAVGGAVKSATLREAVSNWLKVSLVRLKTKVSDFISCSQGSGYATNHSATL